jgi:aspartyl-tRNA(Asn)/glutamyl-tRNA(Gln) amidotransferase subunit C
MPIDIDIAHVARLARIELSEAELAEYGRQCADILEHAGRVQALDTDGVVPTAHPQPLSNAFRDDVITPERILARDEVLGQAPASEDVYFRVPPALEDE